MIEQYRRTVPALSKCVNGKALVYCDWAATAQMPQCVLDVVSESMQLRGTVRRGVHNLGARSTKQLEQARTTIANFIGATSSELILTSGTTHGLNMLVSSVSETLSEGDVVLLSAVEHHAHLLPWQRMSKRYGFSIEIVPLDQYGKIDLEVLERILLEQSVRVIGFPMVSNVLGTLQPVREIVDRVGTDVRVVVDAAQAVAHVPINVSELGIDALVFGGHKLYGPLGTGGLWIKDAWRREFQPSMVGGGAIDSVSYTNVVIARGIRGFEPGTPNVTGFVGLARAIEWFENIGWDRILLQEQQLRDHLQTELSMIPKIHLMTTCPDIPLFTFEVDGLHAHDLGTLLDFEGIVVRTGHHCTQPFHDTKGVESSTRISMSCLNTLEECVYVVEQLKRLIGEFT